MARDQGDGAAAPRRRDDTLNRLKTEMFFNGNDENQRASLEAHVHSVNYMKENPGRVNTPERRKHLENLAPEVGQYLPPAAGQKALANWSEQLITDFEEQEKAKGVERPDLDIPTLGRNFTSLGIDPSSFTVGFYKDGQGNDTDRVYQGMRMLGVVSIPFASFSAEDREKVNADRAEVGLEPLGERATLAQKMSVVMSSFRECSVEEVTNSKTGRKSLSATMGEQLEIPSAEAIGDWLEANGNRKVMSNVGSGRGMETFAEVLSRGEQAEVQAVRREAAGFIQAGRAGMLDEEGNIRRGYAVGIRASAANQIAANALGVPSLTETRAMERRQDGRQMEKTPKGAVELDRQGNEIYRGRPGFVEVGWAKEGAVSHVYPSERRSLQAMEVSRVRDLMGQSVQ